MANVPNRIFFETWADDEGSDIAQFESAQVVTQDSYNDTVIIASIKPEKLGRGSFILTPLPGEVYMLKVRTNRASKDTYHLIPRIND